MNPLVSVIIATRNCADVLPRAMASVWGRGGSRVELLIRDGGSTDATPDLLRRHAERIAWWTSAPDRGVYDAMNDAVRHARGAFVYFLGADDVVLPGFTAALEALASDHVVYYGDVRLASSGARYAGPFDGRKLARTNICHQAIFYPRAVFERRAFDLRYPRLADWAFNMACWSDPALSFEYLPFEIAEYNDRGGMSARAMDWAFYDDYARLLRAHFPPRERRRALWLYRLSRAYRALVGREGVAPGRLR